MMRAAPEALAALVVKACDPAISLAEQHAAFALLVQHTQELVFTLALASLHDIEEAKDAAQDSFALAWRRIGQLRDPVAFESWLKSIVMSQCARRHRRAQLACCVLDDRIGVASDIVDCNYADLVAAAVQSLPEGERNVTVLYYFLGHTQPQIAKLLELKPGTVGKRLHSARLRIRRLLPPTIRNDFVRPAPARNFASQVHRRLLDEYVGNYRFERRPDHAVAILRVGDSLISESAGQRHSLMSAGDNLLATRAYDGEGYFQRNRGGEVTHFVYYEFGRRMGVARKVGASG